MSALVELVDDHPLVPGDSLGGRPRVVFGSTITRGRIVAIDLVMEPARLGEVDVVVLED